MIPCSLCTIAISFDLLLIAPGCLYTLPLSLWNTHSFKMKNAKIKIEGYSFLSNSKQSRSFFRLLPRTELYVGSLPCLLELASLESQHWTYLGQVIWLIRILSIRIVLARLLRSTFQFFKPLTLQVKRFPSPNLHFTLYCSLSCQPIAFDCTQQPCDHKKLGKDSIFLKTQIKVYSVPFLSKPFRITSHFWRHEKLFYRLFVWWLQEVL